MESLKILGKAKLKQIVDDSYRKKAGLEVQKALAKVDEDLAAFDKQMNKTITEFTLKGHPQVEQVRRQFNAEREKLVLYKNQLNASLKAVADLEEGSVVDIGDANFLQEIKIGDNFDITQCEIILKDSVVVAINPIQEAE